MALDDSSPTLALDISGLGPSMAPRSKKRKLDEAELKEREASSDRVEPCRTMPSQLGHLSIQILLVEFIEFWYQGSRVVVWCTNCVGYPTYPCSANLAMASWCQMSWRRSARSSLATCRWHGRSADLGPMWYSYLPWWNDHDWGGTPL